MAERIGCVGCGAVLNDTERHYYTDQCEQCVLEWHESIERWRAGEDNPEMDRIASVPKRTEH